MAGALATPHVHGAAAKVVAGLHTMLTSLLTTAWTHEKAHDDNPFNELVDVAAKDELRRSSPHR